MKSWVDFVNELSEEDFKQIVSDFELFAENGAIGDCLLRSKAQEWGNNVGNSSLVLLTMRNLAFEAYKYFSNRYFEMIK